MIVSRKHKFIYIKATKVAGTSTQVLLSKFCDENDVVTKIGATTGRSVQNYHPTVTYGSHQTAEEIKSKFNIFNSYYKFMTVRNPWDRVVSDFWWRCKGGIKNFKPWLTRDQEKAGPEPLFKWSNIGDDCVLDDYIRYENLEEDTLRILNQFGIDASNMPYPQEKTKIRTSSKHYSEYYDDETREIVAKKYAKDIELFGYEFN